MRVNHIESDPGYQIQPVVEEDGGRKYGPGHSMKKDKYGAELEISFKTIDGNSMTTKNNGHQLHE